jgi:putative ATP-binding cassette transporter
MTISGRRPRKFSRFPPRQKPARERPHLDARHWRIASPYFFRSGDRWPGRLLLAAVIAIELSIVAITVLINEWNARFYNALQDRDWGAFVYQLGYFCVPAAAFIVLAVYQLYLNQWLQIRWRRWLTAE